MNGRRAQELWEYESLKSVLESLLEHDCFKHDTERGIAQRIVKGGPDYRLSEPQQRVFDEFVEKRMRIRCPTCGLDLERCDIPVALDTRRCYRCSGWRDD